MAKQSAKDVRILFVGNSFTARNDLFIDGMRDFGSYYRDPFNTQEIEVLQGASSAAFGRGSTGGAAAAVTAVAWPGREAS